MMIKEIIHSVSRRISIGVKKLIPSSLLARSLLILIVPVILTQMVATFIFFDRHWDNMARRLGQAVAGEIAIIAERIEEVEERGDTEQRLRVISSSARKLNLLVGYDREAESLPEKQKLGWFKEFILHDVSQSLKDYIDKPHLFRVHEPSEWIEVSVKLDHGVLQVLVPEKRLFSSTAYIFLIWMIGSSLILMTIAIIFMRNQIKPIRRLAWAADRMGRGLDVPPLKEQGAREIRAATHAFDVMRERIQRQMEQRTTMLAGVSHDLRTPVTRMKLELAMMDDSPAIEGLKNDLEDMERMIEGYLAFVRGDEETQPLYMDISGLVKSVSEKASTPDVTVEHAIQAGIYITVRPEAIKRAVANVINNAKRHATHVWVRVYRIGAMVELVIEDNGPGIPDDKLEDVFKPFFRLDESRNSKTGGVGLGLSIVRDIINAHGGEVFLEKSVKGGLRVVMRLP